MTSERGGLRLVVPDNIFETKLYLGDLDLTAALEIESIALEPITGQGGGRLTITVHSPYTVEMVSERLTIETDEWGRCRLRALFPEDPAAPAAQPPSEEPTP